MARTFGSLDYTVLGFYLAGIVAFGVLLGGRNRDAGDFFLGGRRVPWWAAGLSIYGTQLSSITFMAIPAKAYSSDWTYVLANLCIPLAAPLVVRYYMPFFRRQNVTTAYEYLERRFNRPVRLFASSLFLLLQLGRLGVVMFLPAIALATVSELDVHLCIVLMGGMATVYTVLGGIRAVIWTDVAQSVVLLGGALLCLLLALHGAGDGLGAALPAAVAAGKFRIFDWRWDWTTTTVWVMLAGNSASVLATYTTDQTVVQKYLATADERRAARSIWTNALLTLPSTAIFFSLGTALYLYYQAHPAALRPGLQPDAILPWFMVERLPAGIAGLVLAGLFAAAQSTISSSAHSMATALAVDFYEPFRPAARETARLRAARGFTFLFGVLGTGAALVLASFPIGSLWDAFLEMLSLAGGSLAGVFTLGIFTRRAHGWGALAGGVASAGLVLLVRAWTPLHFFLYAPVGLVSCVIFGCLASRLTRPRDW